MPSPEKRMYGPTPEEEQEWKEMTKEAIEEQKKKAVEKTEE